MVDKVANPTAPGQATLHDAYAADYDRQVAAYGCYLAEALFGLSYETIQPGEALLDLGIGSGLSAAPFAKAGLTITGMDFSAAMLALCRAKGLAAELKQHDLLNTPWPFPSQAFDHAVCCGVFHFIGDLEAIFAEARRVIRPAGLFAFTTKTASSPLNEGQKYERVTADGQDVFSHSSAYIESLLNQNRFERLKWLRCYVGEDRFETWASVKKA